MHYGQACGSEALAQVVSGRAYTIQESLSKRRYSEHASTSGGVSSKTYEVAVNNKLTRKSVLWESVKQLNSALQHLITLKGRGGYDMTRMVQQGTMDQRSGRRQFDSTTYLEVCSFVTV